MGGLNIESAKLIAADELAKFRAATGNIITLQEEAAPKTTEEVILEKYNKSIKSKVSPDMKWDISGVDYLDKPFFAKRYTTTIFGESGAAKSMLSIGLAAKWTNRGCRVLYINTEDDPLTMFNPRLLANSVNQENFMKICGAIPFDDPDLLKIIVEFKPDAIFWDMLKDMAHDDMDLIMKSGDVRKVISYLNAIAETMNCCCIATHHSNKSGGSKGVNRIQGSMDWFGKSRSILEVAFDDKHDLHNVFHIKANYTRKAKGFAFSLRDKTIGYDSQLKQDITAPEVLWASNMSMTEDDMQPDGANGQTKQEKAAELILQALKESVYERNYERGKAHGTEKYIAAKRLEEIMTDNGISDRTYRYAREELQKKKIIYNERDTYGWYWYLTE